MIWFGIEKKRKVQHYIINLTVLYFYDALRLKANILYKESFKNDTEEERIQTLEEAYNFVINGLAIDQNNSGLLRLNAKIGLQLYPVDKDKVYEVIKRWYDFSCLFSYICF